MRFLALDLGDKRTGVALGDDESGLAFPAEVVEQAVADRAAWVSRLARVIGVYGPDALVVGLPLNMDGSEGPRAALARELAEALRERTGLAAHFQDERLTTEEARWRMSGSGLTRGEKKARKDAVAAAAMLEEFLSKRARGG